MVHCKAAIEGTASLLRVASWLRRIWRPAAWFHLFPEIEFPSVLAYYVVYREQRFGWWRIRDWLLKEAAT